jgi:hypothetical protein
MDSLIEDRASSGGPARLPNRRHFLSTREHGSDGLHSPHGSPPQQFPRLPDKTMPSKVEPYQDLASGMYGQFVDVIRLVKIYGQRLLDKYMLFRVKRSQGDLGMVLNRNTHRDDVHRGLIEERANVGVAMRNPELIGNLVKAS